MEKTIIVLVRQEDPLTPVTLSVNGRSVTIPNNKPTPIPALFEGAARDCGFDIQILDGDAAEEAPDEPAVAIGDGGGSADGDGGSTPVGEQFDAEAIITGNVSDVTARLASLTPEQLALVKAAEVDREKPRTGVLSAIDAALEPAS